MASAVGTDSSRPKAVRWSGASPVRTRAAPMGPTTLSTPVRKRPSNNRTISLLSTATRAGGELSGAELCWS